jgi:hypothetical protein
MADKKNVKAENNGLTRSNDEGEYEGILPESIHINLPWETRHYSYRTLTEVMRMKLMATEKLHYKEEIKL